MSPFERLLLVTRPALAAFSSQRFIMRKEIAMTPQKGKKFRTSETAERIQRLEVTHPHAAGIDVHAAVHFVAVNPADVPEGFVPDDPQLPKGVRNSRMHL